jgi:dolichol kinase
MAKHVIKTWNSENKHIYKKINELAYVSLTVIFGILYPFFILKLGGNYPGVLFPTAVEELTFLGNIFILGVMAGALSWALSAKIKTIKNPELLKDQNNYEVFCEKFLKEWPERGKIKRRTTHVLPVGVVIILLLILYPFQFLLGDAWYGYGMFFMIIVGMDFALTFLIGDLARLLNYSYMPPAAAELFEAGLTPEELDSFTSTSVMVWGFAPFVFFSFPIFFISLLIASVVDAMAAIFGIYAENKGKKHNFPKGSEKSIEGYLGGILFTFICIFAGIAFSNLLGLSNWSIELTFQVAILISIVFFLIDIITIKIKLQDNYLNPLLTGLVLIIYLSLINVSIF